MSFVNNNIIWEVYKNIYKMVDYRNITLEKSSAFNDNEEDFMSNIIHKKYIYLCGRNRHNNYCIIILVHGDILSKTDSTRTMIRNVYLDFKKSHDDFDKDKTNKEKIEFIIIGNNIGKNIYKQTKSDFNIKKSQHETIAQIYKHAEIHLYEFKYFKIEVPKGPNCFPHIIMSEEEKEAFLESQLLDISDLPKILTTDVQIIWIGAKKGDLIKIIRRSPQSGEEIYYRYVIK